MKTGNRPTTTQAQTLFEPFWQLQVPQARKWLRELDRLPRTERVRLLKPTLAFVAEAEHDEVRAWGTSVLATIGGAAALKSLLELVDATADPQHKQRYRFTRFFAARALVVIAEREPTRRVEVTAVLRRIWQDPDERLLAWAGAALTLAAWGDTTARGAVEGWLRADLQYWPNWSVLRAWHALFELHPPSGAGRADARANQQAAADCSGQPIRRHSVPGDRTARSGSGGPAALWRPAGRDHQRPEELRWTLARQVSRCRRARLLTGHGEEL
jgi:hypothetical protein